MVSCTIGIWTCTERPLCPCRRTCTCAALVLVARLVYVIVAACAGPGADARCVSSKTEFAAAECVLMRSCTL